MKQLKSLLFASLLALTGCSTTEAPQAPERVSLFEMNEAGSKYYRIPAMATKAPSAALTKAGMR